MRRILARVLSVRSVRRAVSIFGAAGRLAARAIAWLSAALFGRWQWEPPRWVAFSAEQTRNGYRYVTARRARTLAFLAVLLSAGGAAAWYATRPTPHYVTVSVEPPGLTEYNDKGISSIKPLKVRFSESSAPDRDRHRLGSGGRAGR